MPFYELLNLLKLSQTQDVKDYIYSKITIVSEQVGQTQRLQAFIEDEVFHKFPNNENELTELFSLKVTENELKNNNFFFNFQIGTLIS